MELLVNNKPEILLTGSSLADLMLQLSLLEKRGIAVAVNGAVVPKAGWQAFALNELDKITLIRPTQGG